MTEPTIHEYTQAAHAVLYKIKRVYGLGDAVIPIAPPHQRELDIQIQMPRPLQEARDAHIKKALDSTYWKTAVDRAMSLSPGCAAPTEALDHAAATIMQDYNEAFFLRKQVETIAAMPAATARGRFYRDAKSQKWLVDIYINHLTNRAEAQFEQLGLVPDYAHMLHGALISLSISMYKHYAEDVDNAKIRPEQGSTTQNVKNMADQRAELKAYGTHCAKFLQQEYDAYHASYSPPEKSR